MTNQIAWAPRKKIGCTMDINCAYIQPNGFQNP